MLQGFVARCIVDVEHRGREAYVGLKDENGSVARFLGVLCQNLSIPGAQGLKL